MLSLIVAVAENGAIGLENQMPWHLPGDLKYFKETTMGKTLLMGRKTHESIGRALPGRVNLVLTRDKDYQAAEGCEVVHSIEEAESCTKELMVMGGAELYRQCLHKADRIYLTQVAAKPQADTFFPELDFSEWEEVSRQSREADEQNSYRCDFLVLERKLTPESE